MLSDGDRATAEQSVLLSKMPSEVIDALLARSAVRNFERGALLFMRGEKASSIYVVLEGWVKLSRISNNGAEAIVGVFTDGWSFGEAAAFQGDVYPVAAEAVSDCRVLSIPTQVLQNTMKSSPELCLAMLASTFKHLHDLVFQVEQLKAKTGAQRVAEFLVDLCRADAGPCTVTLPYEKVLIAGRLGMKPESLSRAFGRLKECGVTINQNHAEISDVAQLRDYVERDRAEAWGNYQ